MMWPRSKIESLDLLEPPFAVLRIELWNVFYTAFVVLIVSHIRLLHENDIRQR